uniref:Uncharacterized protein n=1 Tax=Rhizophora mucronata TaxID=61149 RepID=A0A2P2QM75_RHIMU
MQLTCFLISKRTAFGEQARGQHFRSLTDPNKLIVPNICPWLNLLLVSIKMFESDIFMLETYFCCPWHVSQAHSLLCI